MQQEKSTDAVGDTDTDEVYEKFLNEIADIANDLSVQLRLLAKRTRRGPETTISKAFGVPRVAIHFGHPDGQPCTKECHG